MLPIADGEALLNTFVKNNGCTPQNPPVPPPGSLTHIVTTFSGCRPGYPVVFAAFDGGHTPDPVDGSPNSNGDTTWTKTLTWDFFSQFQSTIGTPPGNTVTVTSPGNQSGTVGTAASVQVQAPVILLPGRALAYSATGLPGGAVDQLLDRADLGHARPLRDLHRDRHRARTPPGASGSATFTWAISGGSPPPPSWSGPARRRGAGVVRRRDRPAGRCRR